MNVSDEAAVRARPAVPGTHGAPPPSFLDAAPIAMAWLDDALEFRWANPPFAAIAGVAPESLVGHPLAEAAPALSEFLALRLRHALETGEPSHDTFAPAPAAEGAPRTFAVRVFRLGDGAGRGASVGCVFSETAAGAAGAPRSDGAPEPTAAELAEAVRELDAFAYSISHDLRAPLRAIKGFSGILRDEYAHLLPEEGRRYLSRVEQGATQMTALVNQVLAFSRLSRQPLEKQDVDTAALAREVAQGLIAEEPGRKVELVVGELPRAHADPELLRQVFINLLSNALKFTRGRDPAHVEVGVRRDDPRAPERDVYFVRDNGVGFDMRYSDRLFGVFQRLHSAEEYEGTGAGLAIVSRIVKRHGGTIWGEASPGRGATFSFTLG